MKEQDTPELFRTSAQAASIKDIYILVGVGRVKQEDDIPVNIPHLPSDHLRPVYATVKHEDGRSAVFMRILHMTVVEDRLTMSRTSGGPCGMEELYLSSSDPSSPRKCRRCGPEAQGMGV